MPHLHVDERKPRDLFPLPQVCSGSKPEQIGCRKAYRRALHAAHIQDEVNHTIGSLNSMYGAPAKGAPASLVDLFHGTAAAQGDSLEFIQSMVENMGKPPDDISGPGALKMLRTASGYEDDQPTGSLASFDIEAVSLPEKGWVPVELSTLWGCDGRERMNDFISSQLLPPEESSVRLRASGVARPYSDPLLRQGKLYHEFLRKLHEAGLIDFSRDEGIEQIAFFCVTKKNNRLRLIVDARRSNCHFREPQYVQLTTGEGLGGLEFNPGDHVTIATADLKDAFYHLSLPQALRPYFSLTSVNAGSVGISELDGIKIGKNCKLTPRLAVVPMGWTWALYLCQSVHEALAEKAGLAEECRIRDRHVPPSTQCCHTQYVDNMIVLGTDGDMVKDGYNKAVHELKKSGLQVHDEEAAHEWLERYLEAADGETDFVLTGPATNLNWALRRHPHLASKVGRVFWMAGAVDVDGNIRDSDDGRAQDTAGIDFVTVSADSDGSAEWNAFWDPEGTAELLRLGLDLWLAPRLSWFLVPLDATNAVPVQKDFIQRLDPTKQVSRMAQQIWAMSKFQKSDAVYYMWDTLTVGLYLQPELCSWEQMPLQGHLSGKEQGRISRVESGDRHIVNVAKVTNVPAFVEFLLGLFNR
eukprot:Skav226710  [mRNA]  locus=scaffold3811:147419:158888:+ [translate_table: standard]